MSTTKSMQVSLRLLYFLIALAVVGWVIYWLLCLHFIADVNNGPVLRGQFGDMFGGINALFSACAFAGLIYTALLQRQELALQRQELEENREELKRSADAQEAAQRVLQKQTELLTSSTKMSAWLQAQEVWKKKDFTEGRGLVFDRLRRRATNWTEKEKEEGFEVCRRMDEFAHLVPFLGIEMVLNTWDDPIAKAWIVLKPLIDEERKRGEWEMKWHAFEAIGKQAVQKLLSEKRISLQ